MKAEGLRIGNYVKRNFTLDGDSEITKITGFDLWHSEKLDDVNHLVEWKSLEPIPLTEEWLVKLGFDKSRSTRNLLFDYIIYFERQGDSLYLCNNQTKVQYLIEFVHEAQNIHLDLTGEELTVT